MRRMLEWLNGRKITPGRFFCILGALVVGTVIIEAIISSNNNRIEREYRELKNSNQALLQTLHEYQDEYAFIQTSEGLELFARSKGMSKSGEVRYTVR